MSKHKIICIQNRGTQTCYLGSKNVSSRTGLKVSRGATFSFCETCSANEIYAFSEKDKADVRVMEFFVDDCRKALEPVFIDYSDY